MVYLSEIRTRFGIFSIRRVMCASSLRLKHPASEHESSLTSEKRSVLNPVRFGQLAQLPALGSTLRSFAQDPWCVFLHRLLHDRLTEGSAIAPRFGVNFDLKAHHESSTWQSAPAIPGLAEKG